MSKTLNIIGAGRVGSTLARLWSNAGVFNVGHIVNASVHSAKRAVAYIGAGEVCQNLSGFGECAVWMIGVHDSAIQTTAAALAREWIVKEGDIVFHLSGSLGASELALLAAQGALIASVHPVKSFVAPLSDEEEFTATWCAVEGNPLAIGELQPALEQIGAQVLTLGASNKLLYHAASVFSCNYLSALMEVALRCIEGSGVARNSGLALLEPLVRGTVDNLFKQGPARALTGPIARGDHQLVASQLEAVSSLKDDHAQLYTELGRVAVELAQEAGQVSSEDLEALNDVLTGRG